MKEFEKFDEEILNLEICNIGKIKSKIMYLNSDGK